MLNSVDIRFDLKATQAFSRSRHTESTEKFSLKQKNIKHVMIEMITYPQKISQTSLKSPD